MHSYMVSGVPETLSAACELPRRVGQTALRLDMVSSKLNPIWDRDQPRLVRRAPACLEQPGAVPRRMRRGCFWRLPRAPDVNLSGGVLFALGSSLMRTPSAGAWPTGVLQGRCRRPRGSRSANISRSTVRACLGQTNGATSCWARVGDGVDGAFERVMTIRTWMMSVDGGIGRRLWCVGAGPVVSCKWLSPPSTARRPQHEWLRAKRIPPQS